VVDLAKELNGSTKLVSEIDEGLIQLLAYGSRGEIAPMVAPPFLPPAMAPGL
jgi:hypothetical protein